MCFSMCMIEKKKKIDDWILKLPGLSGRKYRTLINTLISKKNNGVITLNFWGLKDRNGRQKYNKNILSIYDRNLNPNPCLETIKSCLNNGE